MIFFNFARFEFITKFIHLEGSFPFRFLDSLLDAYKRKPIDYRVFPIWFSPSTRTTKQSPLLHHLLNKHTNNTTHRKIKFIQFESFSFTQTHHRCRTNEKKNIVKIINFSYEMRVCCVLCSPNIFHRFANKAGQSSSLKNDNRLLCVYTHRLCVGVYQKTTMANKLAFSQYHMKGMQANLERAIETGEFETQ